MSDPVPGTRVVSKRIRKLLMQRLENKGSEKWLDFVCYSLLDLRMIKKLGDEAALDVIDNCLQEHDLKWLADHCAEADMFYYKGYAERTAKALAQDKPVLKSTCRDGEGLAALYLDRFNELKDESAALGIWLLPHIRHASKEAAVLSRLKEAEGEFEHADIAANNNAREPYSDKLAPRTPPRTFERGEGGRDKDKANDEDQGEENLKSFVPYLPGVSWDEVELCPELKDAPEALRYGVVRLRQDFLDATELKIAEKYVRERNTRLANPDKSEVVKSSTRGQFLREPGLTKSPASPATWTDALCNHIWGELEERISACVAKNGSKYELPSHPYREQYGKNPNNGGFHFDSQATYKARAILRISANGKPSHIHFRIGNRGKEYTVTIQSGQVYVFSDKAGRNVHMSTDDTYRKLRKKEEKEKFRGMNFFHHSAKDFNGLSIVGNIM